MTITVLNTSAEWGVKRQIAVTAKQWDKALKPFPESVRYKAASLAAHNWNVAIVFGQLLISSEHQSDNCWWFIQGHEKPLRVCLREFEILYPIVPQRNKNTIETPDGYRLGIPQYEALLSYLKGET